MTQIEEIVEEIAKLDRDVEVSGNAVAEYFYRQDGGVPNRIKEILCDYVNLVCDHLVKKMIATHVKHNGTESSESFMFFMEFSQLAKACDFPLREIESLIQERISSGFSYGSPAAIELKGMNADHQLGVVVTFDA